MTKKIFLTALAITVIGAGALTATSAFAQSGTDDQNPVTSLVQKIAQKFGLKEADVQAVFDQQRQEHQVKMEAKYEDQLTQYVKDGKITEAQKKLLLDKHNELLENLKENVQKLKDMSPEERKAAMEAKKKELEDWAEQNGIDLKYLRVHRFGLKWHGGMGLWMHGK